MSVSRKSVCHITTLHPRYDVRIFLKECRSLVEDFDTYLIVADGKGDEIRENVKIIDAGLRGGTLRKRIFKTAPGVYKVALGLNCNIYHFHDPEFIYQGYKLKKKGKQVVYDVHEDLPRQIHGKQYLNKAIRPIISFFSEQAEKYFSQYFSAIVTSTPKIRDRFLKINHKTIDICNYVIVNEFTDNSGSLTKENRICYMGGLSSARGIRELVSSLNYIDPSYRLTLAGNFERKDFENEIRAMADWMRVDFVGYVGRKEIARILYSSKIGILGLHPTVSYIDSLPVKLFEYMAAGIPVVASDFPLWREIITGNNCGICINPLSSKEISEAIVFLNTNPEIAKTMGENGRRAVVEKYNWETQKEKLLSLYLTLVFDI